MSFNIQTKLLVIMAGLTVAVLLGVLLSITRELEESIREKVEHDIRLKEEVFRKQELLRWDRLWEIATLIGENPSFKASVRLEDPSTVSNLVEDDFVQYATFDLFIATDRNGHVLARHGEPERYGDDLTYRPSVARALRAEAGPTDWPELWAMGDTLYQVVSVPVWLHGIVGTISAGAAYTQVEADSLKGGRGVIDITFVLNDRHIATTIADLDEAEWHYFAQSNANRVERMLAGLEPSEIFETRLGGEMVYAFVSPLGRGEKAYYLASVPMHQELAIIDKLTENIYVTAAVSILITVALASVLGRTLSRPIHRLVAGMNKVRAGDLDVEVEPTTRDEIGLVTSSFNQMLVGLRERLHLMKYVGTHTIDMIQSSSGEKVALGGSRRELAVLFSDIRGFTSYSERRSPEEVISMLNRYLGFQAEIVPDFDGSIDKFVGDEMVALFTGDDALERAIGCAVAIQRRVSREHEIDPVPIDVGIGVNYGPVILGNMGAESRLDYTVIGADVNLCSRLCAVAGPGQILIPCHLLERLDPPPPVRRTQMMTFKGVSNQLEVAEIGSDG